MKVDYVEAMKLALEALDHNSLFTSLMPGYDGRIIEKAYKAINKALAEQPAQQEPVAWRNAALRVGEDLCSVGPFGYYDMTAEQWLDWALSVVTVHAPPAQQEPVAWKLVPTKPTEEMLKAMDECSKEGYDERLYAGHAASVYMAAVDAAPTPPAQRKPLTDEEIKLVMDGRGEEGDDDYVKPAFDPFGISEDDLMNFARAIEAKLKEKNNG